MILEIFDLMIVVSSIVAFHPVAVAISYLTHFQNMFHLWINQVGGFY